MNKTSKIELSSLIVVIGFFIAVAFHYIAGIYLDKPYPLNTFMFTFKFKVQFSDFFSVYHVNHSFNPYTPGSGSNYFPWAYLLMYPFCFFKSKILGVTLFTIFCTIGVVSFSIYYLKNKIQTASDVFLNIKNIFILTFLTYPFLFSFERGNVEFLVFFSLAFFLFFYERKNYTISAIFLASAIAMKIYPAVFIVLFFADKHYREGFLCGTVVVLMTAISLLLFKGHFFQEILILLKNLAWFRDDYIRSTLNMPRNSSFYAFINVIAHRFQLAPSIFSDLVNLKFVNQYTIWSTIFFMGIAGYLFLVKIDFWKKIMLLTSCMILLPHISYDYKLLHLYLPFFFFINDKNHSSLRNGIIYTLIFSFLLIPKNYYTVYEEVSIGSLLNTLILSFMLFYILIETYRTSRVFEKNS